MSTTGEAQGSNGAIRPATGSGRAKAVAVAFNMAAAKLNVLLEMPSRSHCVRT